MANKKITVLGDTAAESLTPEEEHKIEVKIDKMLAPDVPNEKVVAAEEPELKEEPEETEKPAETPKIQKKTAKILVLDDSEDASKPDEPAPESVLASEVASAPPLPKKSSKRVKIAINDHNDDAEENEAVNEEPAETMPTAVEAEAASEELPAEELPKDSLDIDIPVPESESEPEPAEEETTDVSPVSEEEPAEEAQPEEPEIIDETPPEPLADKPAAKSTKIKVADEAPAEQADSEQSAAKKYRPPDGPLPFKRAESPVSSEPSEIVDDITKDASSKLSDEDAAIAQAFNAKPAKRTLRLPGLQQTKLVRPAVITAVLLVIALAIVVPQVRAMALNLVHVRGSLSLSVLDDKTHLPLSGVTAQIGTVAVTTDQNGKASFKDLKLGSQKVSFQKSAFAPQSKTVFLSWKSAALNDVSLQETGTPFAFDVVDYVSGQPLASVQVSGGSSTAQSDAKGHVNLLVDVAQTGSKEVMFSATGYQPTKVSLPTDPAQKLNVQMIANAKVVYAVKQAGRYNLYKTSVDGNDKTLLLAATGSETSQIDIVASDDGSQAAVVSSRDNQKDKAGYLLDTLSLLDVSTGKNVALNHGQQINIVGWSGHRLVYTLLKPDVSTNDATRSQLISYDTQSKKSTTLDSANDFNDVAMTQGVIYYATANQHSGGTSQLIRISPDGTGKSTLLGNEVTAILRSDYNDLLFMTASNYYAYKLGGAKPAITNSTFSGKGRLYVDSPDGKHSVWVDTAHDKLMLYDKKTNTEKTIVTDADLAYPVRWLNNSTVVYRLSNANIASDYAIGTIGGSAKKIVTVVDTQGLKLWRE